MHNYPTFRKSKPLLLRRIDQIIKIFLQLWPIDCKVINCLRIWAQALVAQRIEHLTTDQKVGGSSPSKRTSPNLTSEECHELKNETYWGHSKIEGCMNHRSAIIGTRSLLHLID